MGLRHRGHRKKQLDMPRIRKTPNATTIKLGLSRDFSTAPPITSAMKKFKYQNLTTMLIFFEDAVICPNDPAIAPDPSRDAALRSPSPAVVVGRCSVIDNQCLCRMPR